MLRIIVLISLSMFVLSGCVQQQVSKVDASSEFKEREQVEIVDVFQQSTSITVGMIGDILLHYPLYTYENYDFAFEDVKEQLTGIDFLLANQESMPGGVELGLSGYPSFNSPKHIIRDLKSNGVDMLSIANNHTIDLREKGIRKALEHMLEYKMPYVGAYTSAEDQAQDRIVVVDGIRIGILAYTYGTNGIPVPEGKPYLVSLIERERMKEEIERLSNITDVLIVSMHWGHEYHLTPSKEQEELAQFVSEAGADIIFGHHPHVIQKYDKVGNTDVFYSLGNFYSAQQFDSTNIGGIARVTITKTTVAGKVVVDISNPSFFPTAVVKDEERRFVIIPLKYAGPSAIYEKDWILDHVGVSSW